MAQSRITWRQAQAFFLAHGYELYRQGGDVIVVAPRGNPGERRTRAPEVIGHKFTKRNSHLLPSHLKRIKLAFGVTENDILAAC